LPFALLFTVVSVTLFIVHAAGGNVLLAVWLMTPVLVPVFGTVFYDGTPEKTESEENDVRVSSPVRLSPENERIEVENIGFASKYPEASSTNIRRRREYADVPSGW